MSGDDKSWLDREKLSFAERDRRRRVGGRSGDEREPRNQIERERSDAAAKQHLNAADDLFAGGKKAERERLASAMRDAHGTPALADACRAFHAAGGLPEDPRLASLFLDAGDREVILLGYEALRAGAENGTVKLSGSLRSQLRILAEDSDDAVADGAEELLEAL